MSFVYRNVDVVRVIDGDTVRLAIDMGNNILWTESFRLKGVDTPERGQVGSREATEFVKNMLIGDISRVETFKPDKFGRWLVDIYLVAPAGGELHLNQMLISAGYAKEYFGGKKEVFDTPVQG